ncbi:serine hydrolase domain-containing protein [Streptomyces sp. NPDC059578]|uniref:serine hydrolase domain-containing protein n=1 Tax=Streptomyces sp. NPDC059578 TaxID=3346874 RepID=UPI0036AE402D
MSRTPRPIPDPAPGTRCRTSAARRGIVRAAVATVVGLATLAMPMATAAAAHSDTRTRGFGKADLQQRLDDIVGLDGVVGAEGTLVDGGQLTHARSGTAELGTDRPVPHQGHFRMGSNTKTFVSTVILQLVEERRMRLDDTVERWLPGLVEGNGNDGKRITVRQLLNHTAGLPDYVSHVPALLGAEAFQQHRYDAFTPRRLVALAMRDRPLFEPGARFGYSNTGYVLAGLIIERVTGNAWDEEVRARITEPLRLRNTYSSGRRFGLPEPHARGYQQFEPGGRLVNSTRLSMTWGDSAGDLVTTSHDLARFWQGLLGGKLLAPKSLAEMKKTVPVPVEGRAVNEHAGLGVFWRELSCGVGSWGHGGTTLGHLNANAFTAKGERGAIVLRSTNLARGDRDARTDALIDAALCAKR